MPRVCSLIAPAGEPVGAPAKTMHPARSSDLHCDCTVHALNAHYRRMGSRPYFRWNTDMETRSARISRPSTDFGGHAEGVMPVT